MPIRTENKARYPKDWPAISLAARERAKWKCQHAGCTATQYSVGRWIIWAGESRHEWRPVEGNTPATTAQDREFFMAGEGRDAHGEPWTYGKAREFMRRYWSPADEDWPTVIVLTVAHLNRQPEDATQKTWAQAVNECVTDPDARARLLAME